LFQFGQSLIKTLLKRFTLCPFKVAHSIDLFHQQGVHFEKTVAWVIDEI